MTTDTLSPLALRPRDAAKLLSISERTLFSLTKAGSIPCIRTGPPDRRGCVLYSVATLQGWLAEHSRADSLALPAVSHLTPRTLPEPPPGS